MINSCKLRWRCAVDHKPSCVCVQDRLPTVHTHTPFFGSHATPGHTNRPTDAISFAGISWPGLIRAVITCAETEVVKSKKGPDANLVKLFRAVAASATRPNRPPTAATRVAGRMFAHTVSRMSEFGLASEVGEAYSRALSSMLASPYLPPLCSAADFAELVRMLCLEAKVLLATAVADGQVSTQFAGASRSVSTTSEITKVLQRLEALLRAVPATLPHTAAQQLLEWFAELFPALAGMHGQHALAHAAVTALSSYFLQHGVQVYASVHTVLPFPSRQPLQESTSGLPSKRCMQPWSAALIAAVALRRPSHLFKYKSVLYIS